MSPLRIAVLGAGPIGIESALYGAALGHDVVVFEQGGVGSSVAMWGHVALFSPWRMNTTPLGKRILQEQGVAGPVGGRSPDPERCPTGGEFVSEYLLPLSQSRLLSGRLRLGCRVVAVGRPGLLKGDLIGKDRRAESRFRLLIEDGSGEHVELADAVLDCTGTYLCPNAIGDGGILAPGERWLTARMIRHLPDVLGRDRGRFVRRRTLLVGDGLSAATAAVALGRLTAEEPGTHVTWAVRRPGGPPYQPIPGDPLPERAQLLEAANRVAQGGGSPGGIQFCAGTLVDGLAAEGHQLRVRLRDSQPAAAAPATKEELFDEVVGLTGYGPDRSIYEQLQIHECYASFGPMKLAATLLAASGGGDCLAQPTPGPATLKNPEPRFLILGAKSYGRSSAFLLQIGHAQVRAAFALLHDDEALDLYAQG